MNFRSVAGLAIIALLVTLVAACAAPTESEELNFLSSDTPAVTSTVTSSAGRAYSAGTQGSFVSRTATYGMLQASDGCWISFSLPATVGAVALDSTAGSSDGSTRAMWDGCGAKSLAGTVQITERTVDWKSGDVAFSVDFTGARFARAAGSAPATTLSGRASYKWTAKEVKAPPTSTGTNTTTGGGTTASVCENSFVIDRLDGYYSSAKVSASLPVAQRTVAATPLRSTASSGEQVIVLNSNEKIEGQTRYQIQLIWPNGRFGVGGVDFIDDANIPGLENGAVGIFVYSVGSSNGVNVTDAFRTNRDWGRNRVTGRLTITAMTPKIQGTFAFQGSGDGYPTLNQYFASVSEGKFCVSP